MAALGRTHRARAPRRVLDASRLTWRRLVVASALTLVVAAAVVATWWSISARTRVTTYNARGSFSAIAVSGDPRSVEIVGGARTDRVEVRREERFAFGRRALERRELDANGVLHLGPRCPSGVLSPCAVDYRLRVPDNIPLRVTTAGGAVRVSRYRGSARIVTAGGGVDIDSFCGFRLTVTTGDGDVRARTLCPTERLELRTERGDIRATVASGVYRVDASSAAGHRRVRGVETSRDAPFVVRAISRSGDVTVEGA